MTPRVQKMRSFIIQFSYYCILLALLYIAFKYALPMLMPFFLGFLFAFLLKPLIAWFERKTRMPRKPVAVIMMLLFYALFTTLCILLGTRIFSALRDLLFQLPFIYSDLLEPALMKLQSILAGTAENLDPAFAAAISNLGTTLTDSLSSLISTISQNAVGWVTSLATALPSFFVKCIITVVVSFYCVMDYYTITSFLVRLLPEKGRSLIFTVKDKGVDVLFQFGRAYAMLMGITFAELFIGFLLLRIENAFLLAFLIAIVDVLPVLGTGTILIPWCAAELILGDYPLGIGLLVLYLIVTVVRQMLEPRIVGKQIGLYPLVTLICMFVGTYLFGALGLFGLPILATVLMQLQRSGELSLFRFPGALAKPQKGGAEAQTDAGSTPAPAEASKGKGGSSAQSVSAPR